MQEEIYVGAVPNDGTGDTLRVSFIKTNNNFTELYSHHTNTTANIANIVIDIGVLEANILANANINFDTAVSAFDTANAAFNKANGVHTNTTVAFARVNAQYLIANAAFDQSNIAYTESNSAYVLASSAFDNSNTSLQPTGGVITGNYRIRANVEFDSGKGMFFGREEIFGDTNIGGNDFGYILYENDTTQYGSGSGESALLRIGIGNDDNSANIGDSIAIEATGDIFIKPARLTGVEGKLYVGDFADKFLIWHEGNDGSDSGLNADLLDGFHHTAFSVNTAFDVANAAFTTANGVITNVNSAIVVASAGYNTVNAAFTTANAAFGNANATLVIASAGYNTVNAAFDIANAAFAAANGSAPNATVNVVYNFVNTVYNFSNSVFDVSNAAFTNANATLVVASAAFTNANATLVVASAGYNVANAAFTNANATLVVASAGYNVANAAFGKANTSLTNADFALTVASAGYNVANAAFTNANATLVIASAAFNAANNAVTDYSPAFNKANDALTVAASSFNNANATLVIASAAFSNANTAGVTASAAFDRANSVSSNTTFIAAFDKANAANVLASAAFDRANTVGFSVNVDESSNVTHYPLFTTNTQGTIAYANVSNSGLYFVPVTGTLSATVFNSLSDRTVKENIEPIVDALDIIEKMNGVSFTWKKTGRPSFGLIAQELEKVAPALVDEVEGLKTVNYDAIIAFLIEAIKELKNK